MSYEEGLKQIDKASQKIVEGNQLISDTVMNSFLFTWQWWISLVLLIIPWICWFIFRNNESSARIFSAGLLVMVLSEVIDALGVSYGRWIYPVKVIPLATLNLSFRLSVVPVAVMLLLQYKPNLNPYIKAVGFGAFGAYVAMPFMALIDLYKKIDWAYTYSFFILTLLYLFAHWISRAKSFDPI